MGLLRGTLPGRLWRGLLLLALAGGVAGAAAPVSEYQLKAVFLFNFAQFVEWPPQALAHPGAPFVIGILGLDPFGASLDQVVHGERVNHHPLTVERYHDVSRGRRAPSLLLRTFLPTA
jgi:hypothetical protein